MSDVGPDPVQVITEAAEVPTVRIVWTSSGCTDQAWMNVSASPDRAFFQVSPSAGCILIDAAVDAIEIVLSRPVDVSVARVVPV